MKNKTPDYRLRANARYQKKLVAWVARAKEGTDYAEALERAKQSGELPEMFKKWILDNF